MSLKAISTLEMEAPAPRRYWIPLTIKIVTVLAAIGVASSLWILWVLSTGYRQKASVERLRGSVWTQMCPPAWLSRYVGNAWGPFFNVVTGANLSGTEVTDSSVARVKRMNTLEVLFLAHTQVGDAGLVNVRALTNLRYLDLS